jgi:outer membrane murein-binding lipoprotein Lpp
MGIASPAAAAVRGFGAAIDRLDRILSSLETVGGSIASMERDMRGMRNDLQSAVASIEALRGDVRGLDGSVQGIREATESLEAKVDELGGSLKRIDALVPRITRRARAQARAAQETA